VLNGYLFFLLLLFELLLVVKVLRVFHGYSPLHES